jgi:hypothetical protein
MATYMAGYQPASLVRIQDRVGPRYLVVPLEYISVSGWLETLRSGPRLGADHGEVSEVRVGPWYLVVPLKYIPV